MNFFHVFKKLKLIGEFRDYKYNSDSLIGFGKITFKSNNKYELDEFSGDSTLIPVILKMCELKPSFIRINDYPKLKKVIRPTPRHDQTEKEEFGVWYVQKQPEFPGGMETLAWFISQLIKYPPEAEKNGISGVVKVKFMIDADGSLKNFSVIDGIGYGCDEEAIRVMKLIPDWIPGEQSGAKVKTYFIIPIKF